MSDLVVSGTIEATSPTGARIVDRTELTANIAHVRIDRVFQGEVAHEFRFTWFTVAAVATSGFIYSGPPLAGFQRRKRYLIFLRRDAFGWVVAMPLYALEVELAPAPPPGLPDLSQASLQSRYEAIAEELETAALLVPVPPPGMTGEAATYFPSVFDLLGKCAEPFYRRFLSSPSPELRGAALRWLAVIQRHHTTCKPTGAPRAALP